MKTILIYNPLLMWVFHLEASLEIVNAHLRQGDRLIYLTCDADLPSCDPNPHHDLNLCRNKCILNRRYQGFEVTELFGKVEFRSFVLLSAKEIAEIQAFPKKPKSLRQLKSLKISNCDIGMAVASSLISYVREPYPNPRHYQSYVEANIIAGLKVYFSIINHLKMIQPDKIYIFNGRFASLRPAVRAAELLAVPYEIQELASVNGKYSLTSNATPHNLEYQSRLIASFWDTSNKHLLEKVEIGSKWFIDRRCGVEQGWHSYIVDKQDAPDFIDPQKLNIVIFNSSQDEYEAIEGWQNPIYRSQTEGLYKLARDLGNLANIDIYLRVHPNLSGVNNSQTRAIEKLKGRYKNFHIIDAGSPVNSYLLLDQADLVITFGSTMGIEAIFWNKPSVLCGRAIYEDLGAVHVASCHSEVISLIRSESFRDKFTNMEERKLGAFKYGFYMQDYGIPFELFEAENYWKLVHKGTGIYIDRDIHWREKQMREQLEPLQQQLQLTQRKLTSMKLSKFWKLRNLWFKKIKRKLGLSR